MTALDITDIENRPVISIGCVSNVYIRQMHFKKAGDKNEPDTHNWTTVGTWSITF